MAYAPDTEIHKLNPGDWNWLGEVLYVCLPDGSMANLANHTVSGPKEAPSAIPSILCRRHDRSWHGYLTDGQLREL